MNLIKKNLDKDSGKVVTVCMPHPPLPKNNILSYILEKVQIYSLGKFIVNKIMRFFRRAIIKS